MRPLTGPSMPTASMMTTGPESSLPQRHNSRGSEARAAPSSKSVLTVALQRAQSAVLLDSANNYPSAIAAYSQAVRLLKEVMARVEDGSREMERKLSDAGTAPRPGESEDEWGRRRAKYERKEKAKLDEARRLRVIVRLIEASVRWKPGWADPFRVILVRSSRGPQHDTYEDRIRMLVQMGTPLPPPSPSFGSASSFPSSASSFPPSPDPLRATNHYRQPSSPLDPHRPLASHPYAYDAIASTPRTAAFAALQDGDGQGIGAAMLQLGQAGNSGVMASSTNEPVLSRLPVVTGDDRLSPGLEQPRQPTRPLSFASDSTAIAIARTTATDGAGSPVGFPSPVPLSPLDPMLALPVEVESAAPGPDGGTFALGDATMQPHGFTIAGDDPTVQPSRRHGAPTMRRGQSFGGDGSFRPVADGRPIEMMRGYSTGSIVPVRRGSSISALAFVEEGGAPVDIRPRPTRNASLVNPTTQDGTIGQRRHHQQGSLEASIVVRAPSTDTERATPVDDFGQPRDSAKHESWATGSLPARLRSLSTSTGSGSGSRRPKLPPFEEMPVPGGHRTTLSGSSSGPPSRKSSVPTPTSLNAPSLGAPSLGRSPSASSIGSSASSSYPRRRVRPSFSGHASSQSVSSSGVYLSAGLANHPPPDATSREATLAIHPARRPFHLMRLVLSTMPPSAGGYVSEKLFIPAQIWTTSAGAKLVALETKVRMLDLLGTGLDALERAGRGLLLVPTASASARAVARQEADRFARELDGFEGLTEGVQSTLVRKSVSSAVEPKTGRKGSTVGRGAPSGVRHRLTFGSGVFTGQLCVVEFQVVAVVESGHERCKVGFDCPCAGESC